MPRSENSSAGDVVDGPLPDDAIRKLAALAAEGGDPEEPRLRRYALWEPLGEGATGVVYRARDLALGRSVAVKVLKKEVAARPDARERFWREAQAAARIAHPHVVALHDLGEEGGRQYVVMELIDGRSLRAVLAEESWPLDRLIALLARVADGVHHAHGAGVVHRDLKPENILVTRDGEPKVTDFGLAHLLHSESSLTRTGAALGTPAYMAPEQAAGRHGQISQRTDIYALGAILYEMLAGRPPHMGATAAEVGAKIITEEPLPPGRVRAGVPAALEAVALRALEKDPARRFAGADELALELRRHLAGEPVASRAPGLARRALGGMRRRPGVAVAATATLVAIGAVAAVAAVRRVERDAALALIRETARAAVEDALHLRRNGVRGEMRRLLPRLEVAYARALARMPDQAEVEYLMARMHRALMDDDRALGFAERALDKDPEFAPALYERVVLASKQYGLKRQRAELLAQALDVAPARAEDLARPGVGSADDADRAALEGFRRRILTDLAALDRLRGRAGIGSPMLLAARGMLAHHEGRHADALRLLEQATRADPDLEEAWDTLGLSAIALGRAEREPAQRRRWFEKAEGIFTQASDHDRGYAPHWHLRASAREQLAEARGDDRAAAVADYDLALAHHGEAIRADPGWALAWRMRAHARYYRGKRLRRAGEGDPRADWSEALSDLGEALRLDAGSAAAWAMRARIRYHRGQYAWSRQRIDPTGDWRAAEADYRESLRLDPRRHVSWIWLGRLRASRADHLRKTGTPDPRLEWAAAEEHFTEAIRIAPAQPEAWRARGQLRRTRADAARDRGDSPLPLWSQAEGDLGEAIRLAPALDALRARRDLRIERAAYRERHGRSAEALADRAAAGIDEAEAARLAVVASAASESGAPDASD